MMPTYDGSNFYQFYDFAVGDLVVYYDFDCKKTIGIVIKMDSNYLEIHWSGQTCPTTFNRSEMENGDLVSVNTKIARNTRT